MSLAGANDTRFRNKMRISRKNGSGVDGCRRARNSLGQLGKILGKNRNWPSVLCGKCGNRKICPRFHIGGESSGANGCNFPQMPRLPHSKTCSEIPSHNRQMRVMVPPNNGNKQQLPTRHNGPNSDGQYASK